MAYDTQAILVPAYAVQAAFRLSVIGLSDYEAELLAPLEASMRSYVEGAVGLGIPADEIASDLREMSNGSLQGLELSVIHPKIGPTVYSALAFKKQVVVAPVVVAKSVSAPA